MATLDTIPGVFGIIRKLVVDDKMSYEDTSSQLRMLFPTIGRGLSERSVRRFCQEHNLHRTSRLNDTALDTVVRNCVSKVGSSYGRRMMTGLLSSQGVRVCQLRVGRSLQRVNPGHHHRRFTRTHQLTNPVPYRSDYVGEKLHIDQNEKLVMFGATHVCAVDGHSGKIIAFKSMPIKNNIVIYEHIYMKAVSEYGLWNQLRVDKGREWYLMLFIQEKLAHLRTGRDNRRPSFLQTSSKQNHMIERLWVEVNSRVNYPIKRVLIEMESTGTINMGDNLHKYCVSWFTIKVFAVGIQMFIESWNNHPIPGRRRGGMRSHVPNDIIRESNQITAIDLRHLPSATQAVNMYQQEQGRISDESQFGEDPLHNEPTKCSIRSQAFSDRYPCVDNIFHELVNSNSTTFKNALSFYIDITYRLSRS